MVGKIGDVGVPGYTGDGGLAISAQLDSPYGVAVDSFSNIYIADSGNNVIRKVDIHGRISTVAGSSTGTYGYSGDGGSATDALLDHPHGVAVDALGSIYIADTNNNVIRKVIY